MSTNAGMMDVVVASRGEWRRLKAVKSFFMQLVGLVIAVLMLDLVGLVLPTRASELYGTCMVAGGLLSFMFMAVSIQARPDLTLRLSLLTIGFSTLAAEVLYYKFAGFYELFGLVTDRI